MVLFCFLWFLVLYFLAYKLAKNSDFFSPFKFIPFKYALLNLPFLLLIAISPKSFYKAILVVCNTNLNDAVLKYTIVQTIAFVSLITGMYIYKKWQNKQIPIIHNSNPHNYSYKIVKTIAVAFLAIGTGAYIIFIYRIGGLLYLLTHLDKRVELQSGQYILQFLGLLSYSVLFLLLCIRLKDKLADKVLMVSVLLLSVLIFSSFGARKNAITLIIMVIVGYHYIVKPITFTIKNKIVFGVLSLLLVFYILIVPVLRKKDGLSRIESERVNYGSILNIHKLVYNVSYTYIDIFAANYYNTNNAWYMAGFTDPVKIALTKGDKSVVPPMDQGVYFYNTVVNNKDYRPSTPRGEMKKNSWPIENFGFSYANFLIPGVVLFFFLQGLVFSFFYDVLKRQAYNPVLIYLYVFIIFNFNFSSLRLVAFAMITPFVVLTYYLLKVAVVKRAT